MKNTIWFLPSLLFLLSACGDGDSVRSKVETPSLSPNQVLGLADEAEEALIKQDRCSITKEVTFSGASYEKYNILMECPIVSELRAAEQLNNNLERFIKFTQHASIVSSSESQRNLLLAKNEAAKKIVEQHKVRLNQLRADDLRRKEEKRIADEDLKKREAEEQKKLTEANSYLQDLKKTLSELGVYIHDVYYKKDILRFDPVARELLLLLNDQTVRNSISARAKASLSYDILSKDCSDISEGNSNLDTDSFDLEVKICQKHTAVQIVGEIQKLPLRDDPKSIEREALVTSIKERTKVLASNKPNNLTIGFYSYRISEILPQLEKLERLFTLLEHSDFLKIYNFHVGSVRNQEYSYNSSKGLRLFNVSLNNSETPEEWATFIRKFTKD